MTDVVKKGIDKVRLMYVASMRALALARSTSAHRRQQVLMFFHSVALCPKLTACARDDNGRAEYSNEVSPKLQRSFSTSTLVVRRLRMNNECMDF
jgi:hypothetical protein